MLMIKTTLQFFQPLFCITYIYKEWRYKWLKFLGLISFWLNIYLKRKLSSSIQLYLSVQSLLSISIFSYMQQCLICSISLNKKSFIFPIGCLIILQVFFFLYIFIILAVMVNLSCLFINISEYDPDFVLYCFLFSLLCLCLYRTLSVEIIYA